MKSAKPKHPPASAAQAPAPRRLRGAGLAAGVIIACSCGLALAGALADSITYDEPDHLTAGVSYWKTGDFRLGADHPPLARLWYALPVVLMDCPWPADLPGWKEGVVGWVHPTWLFDLMQADYAVGLGRCMAVVLLAALLTLLYRLARELHGQAGALISLLLAGLCPTLLAHGHLVTTDLPMALGTLAVIAATAWLLGRVTVVRVLVTGLLLGALALAKMSWPVVLPALGAMVALAAVRPRLADVDSRLSSMAIGRRLGVLVAAVGGVGALAVLTIWACYGFRYAAYNRLEYAAALEQGVPKETSRFAVAFPPNWEFVLNGRGKSEDKRGLLLSVVAASRALRLLPEPYLYGIAAAHRSALARKAYLMGEFSGYGWRSYFPIAFLIKTPIPTLAAVVLGIAAVIAWRRVGTLQNPILVLGLTVFVIVYGLTAITSSLNIGHRHLLPIYPPLLILAGAAAYWLRWRAGQALMGAVLLWLIAANLTSFANYLPYFNEFIGGPAYGHRYLADSNIDWGQDLKRLRDWVATTKPPQPLVISYFGSADVQHYGLPLENFEKLDEFQAGTYIISVTHLLGVYKDWRRDAVWDDPGLQEQYAAMYSAPARAAAGDTRLSPPLLERLRQEFFELARERLVQQLRRQKPDARVGGSLWIYHLDKAEITRLITPPANWLAQAAR